MTTRERRLVFAGQGCIAVTLHVIILTLGALNDLLVLVMALVLAGDQSEIQGHSSSQGIGIATISNTFFIFLNKKLDFS